MTANEMRELANSNPEKQKAIRESISKMEARIKDSARQGRFRCSWDIYELPDDIAQEVKRYFENGGFVIKDPHEYCGGVLQVGEWIYW